MSRSETSPPRVTATYTIEPNTVRTNGSKRLDVSPSVFLEVLFDLGTHEAALAALDEAVGAVRAQIMQTGNVGSGDAS